MKLCTWVTLLFLLFHFGIQAQTSITGMVKDSLNTPLPFVTVYLSKTTIGTLTNDKGVYALTIPRDGVYEMIFSCVGYKSISKIITAKGIKQTIDIKLSENTILLNEFTVNEKDKNREKFYSKFVNSFIGKTPNSYSCKIINPKDIYIYNDYQSKLLKAYSLNPLIIENKALGYTVIFDLTEFQYDLKTEHLRFSGNSYFKTLIGNPKQEIRWERNRLNAYYGSRTHFLRALFSDSLNQENFEIGEFEIDHLTKVWSAIKPIKVVYGSSVLNKKSLTVYHDKEIVIKYKDPESIFIGYSPRIHLSYISFNDSLKVFQNGYCGDSYHVTWGGEMADERIADMLPFDFMPKKR